jgi:membrane protein
VVVLLVWVYYSAIIVFLGAELTQVWAKYSGLRITPDEHARPEQPKQKAPAHAN